MPRESLPILYIVIPCYNEEEVLPVTAPLFLEKLQGLVGAELIHPDSRIMFVDDGSQDSTWDIIRSLARKEPHYLGIAQSRNRGHQSAVLAGLLEAKEQADITISIDCDGQDDLSAMDDMVRAFLGGAEIVYGVRKRRDTDSFFKRFSAQAFYKIMNWMGAEVIYNHADYRLVSRRALEAFADFREVNLFLRGIFPLVGFNTAIVYYDRQERLAGESHYPLGKMLSLAADGITSMSIKPIRMVTAAGGIVSVLGLIAAIWAVIMWAVGRTVPGWTSLMCVIVILGGLNLLAIGIVGEYVGKTYMEAKARPRYIISDRTEEPDGEEDKRL